MTLALIDGDILIYKAACSAEKEVRWPDGVWTYQADEKDGIEIIENKIKSILKGAKADEYIVCFTDEDENFRKGINPDYKANRSSLRKPLILKAMRNYCLLNHPCAVYPTLEADDVMGILATHPENKAHSIIATIDKDLAQIPVPIYNIDTQRISKPGNRDGIRLMYRQVLVGDIIDGYYGCPGVGDTTAEEILDNPFLWERYEHVFKSGPRKGESEMRWRKGRSCTTWESIVSHFVKAGLTEMDALVQARCAYILQAEDYKDGTVKLWEPMYG